jgi:ribosomal protein RSM22 (predicted rRNA methylase)
MGPFNQPGVQRVSTLLEKIVAQAAARDHSISGPRLHQAVQELSHLFTRGKQSLPADYLEVPGFAAAYLSYFLPVNAAKIQVLLDELPIQRDLAGRSDEPFVVLDLGSGPGTAALAVLDWMVQRFGKNAPLGLLSVDRSEAALNDSALLWERYCGEAGASRAVLKTHRGDLETLPGGALEKVLQADAPYDLIVIANCLNELYCGSGDPISRRAELIGALLPFLQPHGSVMIVEPALRQASRDLHRVRDQVVLSKQCTVYSPCLHEQACPALVREDDWCHEERAWTPAAAIQAIDREVGFIKDALKFSYLLLRKDERTIVKRQPDIYRVVSELREFKGEKRAWLCNELGRSEVGRLDRKASPQNAAFEVWHRGAIVQIERIVRKERDGKVSALGRIEQDVAVQIVRSV